MNTSNAAFSTSFDGDPNSIPDNIPNPRTSFTISNGANSSRNRCRNSSPSSVARAPSDSFSNTSSVASPARIDKLFSLNVDVCMIARRSDE